MLVASGLVSASNVDRALSAQAHRQIRIGTMLRNSGVATGEVITRMLARQLGVPAALARHLDSVDRRAAAQIPAAFARANVVVPLLPAADGTVVVCARDPKTPGLAAGLAQYLTGKIVLAVALEGPLTALADQLYDGDGDVAVDLDFDEPRAGRVSRGHGRPAVARTTKNPVAEHTFELTTLDDLSVARTVVTADLPRPAASAPTPSQNAGNSILTAANEAAQTVNPPAPAPAPAPAPVPRGPRTTLSPAAATELLARAGERDAVNAAMLDCARQFADAAVFLVVKNDVALGHDGFGGSLSGAVTAIALPLSLPSTVRDVIDRNTDFLGPRPTEGSVIWTRLLTLLGPSPFLGVHRVMVAGRTVGVLVSALAHSDNTNAKSLAALCNSAGEAYTRIVRDKKKPK